jgi:hypothetical protein
MARDFEGVKQCDSSVCSGRAVTFDSSRIATRRYKVVQLFERVAILLRRKNSMRKRLIHTILLAGFLCAPAFAQRVEIFGGAQYEHLQSSYNAVGWNASLTGNFKHVLGITGDLSGVYNSHRTNSSVYTYTVGPVLTARLPVVQPFVHALFGGATISTRGTSDNAFAMLVGGGLDIGLRKGIGLRLVQADWLMTKFGDQTQDRQGRVSAGIVIKF